MFKERYKQGLLSLKASAIPPCNRCKRVEFAGIEVSHRVHFEVPPTIFEGIKFRSVGRQEKGNEMGILLHKCSDLSGTMGGQAIPDQDHRTSYLSQELAEKIQNECSSNVAIGMEAEILGRCGAVPG